MAARVRCVLCRSGPTSKVAEVRTRKKVIYFPRPALGRGPGYLSFHAQLLHVHESGDPTMRHAHRTIHTQNAPRTYDTHVNISVDSSHHLYGVVPVTRRAIRAARAMMPRTAHTWSPGTLAHNSVSRISGRGLVALERYTSAISKSCSPPAHPVISRLGRRYLRLRTPHGGRVLMPRAQPLHPHGTAERLDT